MQLFWKTKLSLWRDQLKTIFSFYRNPRSALADLLLGAAYLFSNPFRICRRHLEKKGEGNIHMYGETPLSVWKEIAQLADLGPGDTFIDLGCGRGKLCFWSATWIGCRTIGVDWVSPFIRRGSFLARLQGLSRLQFFERSLSKAELQGATVLYLYTFHPEEESLDLPKGCRVITVSEPLSHPFFRILASKTVSFPWGEAEVFVQSRFD